MNIHAFKYILVLLLTGLFLSPAYSQSGSEAVYLEWVQNPLRSMVVNWIVDEGSAGASLEYRSGSSGSWNSASGSSHSIPHSSKQRNSVSLTGLSPGSTYEFRVNGSSEIMRFRTAPSSVSSPLRFVVGGDLFAETTSSGDKQNLVDRFRDISSRAASHNPYFAVLGGDLAHATSRSEWVDQMLDMLPLWKEHMVTQGGFLIPIVAVIGNNDVAGSYGGDASDAAAFHALFSFPQDQWSEIRGYGVLDFSDYLSIITLDSGHSTPIEGTQTQWLGQNLSNRSGVRHVFPVYHQAGWPTFRTFRGTHEDPVRNNWHPLFEENSIRLVFEHHDHLYKRTHPIGECRVPINNSNDCELESTGVIYAGGGPWAANTRSLNSTFEPDGAWYHDVWESTHNFVLVEITATNRKMTTYNRNGSSIDSFSEVVFLPAPEALSASHTSASGFRANWEPVSDATGYRLDVSTRSNFSSFVSGYQNRNVGDVTHRNVTGLEPNQTYYYRVRAQTSTVTSSSSSTISVQLISVDPDLSAMSADETEVLADGEHHSTISVIVRDENGEEIEGVQVQLGQGGGSSQITTVQGTTDSDGEARFRVRNNRAERITYTASAGGTTISESVTIDFLPVPPDVMSAGNVNATEFTARWGSVQGADRYRLDVSDSSDFSTFLSGKENLDVGTETQHHLTGLTPGTTYYYRLRTEAVTGTSDNSSVRSVRTLEADADQTTVRAASETVLADGESSTVITVTVRSEGGTRLDGVEVQLNQGDGRSEITTVQGISDSDGEASFTVTNEIAEFVSYSARAGEVAISQSASVAYTPMPPVALEAIEIGAIVFTANWEEVQGASGYHLDVSEDPDFESFIPDYDNKDTGDVTEHVVSGVEPGAIYYYRVRAEAPTGISDPSGTIELQTLEINTDGSSIRAAVNRVLANGEQAGRITVSVVDEQNLPLEDVPVRLESNSGNVEIEPEIKATDQNGEALFEVISNRAGTETFTAYVGGLQLGDVIEIEFLPEEGEIKLGHNYPNPFNNETRIPITIPEQMHVRVDVANSAGAIVKTLLDENRAAGYYEIIFRGQGLASGVYFYRLITREGVKTEKMLFVK